MSKMWTEEIRGQGDNTSLISSEPVDLHDLAFGLPFLIVIILIMQLYLWWRSKRGVNDALEMS